ncbi:MAG TPA: DUF6790 family protein [Candidatus Baltobacteraceae bacterium]|nr:DUF6790 family protein [Candidatus Baltobacteraceae bacterium]
MMIRGVIGFILSNIQVPLLIVAVIVTIVKLRRASARHEVMSTTYTLWGEVLFYCFGLALVYAWYFHAFIANQWELAWAELGVGTVAMLSLWRGYDMRLAATLASSICLFGAAAQHIHLVRLWFGDIALPLFTLFLAYGSRDAYERIVRRAY